MAFARLRMYTHIYMIWLGLLLAGVVLLEVLRRERLFPLCMLLASLGFVLTLALINVDGSIVRQNVARTSQGQSLDVPYLASLSSDSASRPGAGFPVCLPAFRNPPGVGAVLVCRRFTDPARPDAGWRSFTLSRYWGDLALKTVQPA